MSQDTRPPSSPRPIIPLPDIRLAGIPLASVLDAALDFLLAAAFARAVWQPDLVGSRGIQWLDLAILMEFLIIHSSAVLGGALLDDTPRWKRIMVLFGCSLGYLLFAAALGSGYQSWYPIGILVGLTLNRLLFILLRHPATITPLEKGEITRTWQFGVVSYLLSMLVGMFLASILQAHWWSVEVYDRLLVLDGNMSGTLDGPLVAGVLYFSARGIRELFFSREIGRPGYETNDAGSLEEREVLGININLWYLAWRYIVGISLTLAFAGMIGSLTGGILGLVLFALFAFVCAALVVYNYRWLRQASALMCRPPQRLRVRVLDQEDAGKAVSRLALYRPREKKPLVNELPVETVSRRNFLAPGETECDADIFLNPDPAAPTVIRVGRTHLCGGFYTKRS